MVEILNRLTVIWLINKVKKSQTKINFYKNYLPLRKEFLEEKQKSKLHNLDLKYRHNLLPYEIKAGINSDFLNKNLDSEESKIEEKYYWKQRALKQTIKRKGIKGNLLIDKLLEEKKLILKDLENKYFIKTPSNENITNYENHKKKVSINYENRKKNINNIFNDKISKTTKKIEKNINRYNQILSSNETKLKKIQVKSSYILEEDVLLKIDNLSMNFGGLKAVNKLSFSVKQGEIFGLIGPNGAGKTTVFNCITRFYKPTDGDMYFRNRLNEIVHLNDIAVHNIIKEGIVRTFQNVEMVWELNVLENLLVAAHTNYRSGFFGHLFNSRLLRQEEKVTRNKALKILKDLDLLQYAYSFPYGLPYGILKKIELARTLMIDPKLIILDEPAAGLNDAETIALANTIKKIRDEYKATIFLVEHDMGLVMNICDTICAISFGIKLDIGKPKEIQKSKIVQTAYLGGE